MKQQATQLLWALYALIQGLVIMSRMYIAAHFPHQCILGLFLGNYLNSPSGFHLPFTYFLFYFLCKTRYYGGETNLWLPEMAQSEA